MFWNLFPNDQGYNTMDGVGQENSQRAILGTNNFSFTLNPDSSKFNDPTYIFQCGLKSKITTTQRYVISTSTGCVCIYNGSVLENIILPAHAYSIFGISGTTVTIRNPWGECILREGTQSIRYIGGLVDIPLSDFMYLFVTWYSILS